MASEDDKNASESKYGANSPLLATWGH